MLRPSQTAPSATDQLPTSTCSAMVPATTAASEERPAAAISVTYSRKVRRALVPPPSTRWGAQRRTTRAPTRPCTTLGTAKVAAVTGSTPVKKLKPNVATASTATPPGHQREGIRAIRTIDAPAAGHTSESSSPGTDVARPTRPSST